MSLCLALRVAGSSRVVVYCLSIVNALKFSLEYFVRKGVFCMCSTVSLETAAELLNPEVRAQFGCRHGRNGFHRIQSVSSTVVSRFNYPVGINGRTPEYPQIIQERFKKVLKEYSS